MLTPDGRRLPQSRTVNGGVPASSLGTQPIGEISQIVDGVYQLKLPVPFPLKFIASYLLPGVAGWTIIDPGFDYPPAREAWELGAAEVRLDLESDIAQIIVTHLHPDHIGLTRWLEERSGAPVRMLSGEIENSRQIWDPERGTESFVEFLVRNGMDAQTAEAATGTTRIGVRVPEWLDGDVVVSYRAF